MWIFKIFSGGNTPGPPLKGDDETEEWATGDRGQGREEREKEVVGEEDGEDVEERFRGEWGRRLPTEVGGTCFQASEGDRRHCFW